MGAHRAVWSSGRSIVVRFAAFELGGPGTGGSLFPGRPVMVVIACVVQSITPPPGTPANHEKAAVRLDEAALFWEERRDDARAALCRETAAHERAGAALQRRWVDLLDDDPDGQPVAESLTVDDGDIDVEGHEVALEMRESWLDLREQDVCRRESAAQARDRLADERDERADAREDVADHQRLADEREGTAEARETERPDRVHQREQRERAAARREQAEVEREQAASEREAHRPE